jgi:hypothetical protein
MFCVYRVNAIGNRLKGFNGRYYTSVHTFSFQDISREQFRNSVVMWCWDQYGEDPENLRWWLFGQAVAILEDDDAVAFRMRWGGQTDG